MPTILNCVGLGHNSLSFGYLYRLCSCYCSNHHAIMENLPVARVQAARLFSKVGIDYAGPLSIRECCLRKPREFKINIAVFVCTVVKVVHLEYVLELSTNAFLTAFDKFMSKEIFSDCGTNFIGASKQLRLLVNHPENQIHFTSYAICTLLMELQSTSCVPFWWSMGSRCAVN